MTRATALLVFRLLRRGVKWSEACPHCKGYPKPWGARCRCSLSVRLRRWARGHV